MFKYAPFFNNATPLSTTSGEEISSPTKISLSAPSERGDEKTFKFKKKKKSIKNFTSEILPSAIKWLINGLKYIRIYCGEFK